MCVMCDNNALEVVVEFYMFALPACDGKNNFLKGKKKPQKNAIVLVFMFLLLNILISITSKRENRDDLHLARLLFVYIRRGEWGV